MEETCRTQRSEDVVERELESLKNTSKMACQRRLFSHCSYMFGATQINEQARNRNQEVKTKRGEGKKNKVLYADADAKGVSLYAMPR